MDSQSIVRSLAPAAVPATRALVVESRTSGTSNGAAQRGFEVVVPVDGMSSEEAFNELYAAWHLYKGGPAALVDHVTLSRSDLIKFGS